MNFNEIVKKTLLPTISSYGFTLYDEYKGEVDFCSGAFKISTSYDYLLSKDLNWRLCYQKDEKNNFCIEDFDVAAVLNYSSQKYEKLPEDEQIYKFARYCEEILRNHGAALFNKEGFLQIWEKSTLKIIL